MTRIGTVTGRTVTRNRDSATDRLMLQVQLTNADDIQTVEYVPMPGTDANPINGTRVYIFEVSASYKIAIGAVPTVTPSSDTGENFLLSTDDSGVVQALIKLLKTGIIEINGNADFAIRFNALDTALQSMLTALNADIAVAGGAGNTTLDISAAKVDEVKLS